MDERSLPVYFCKHGFCGFLKYFHLFQLENAEKIWEVLPMCRKISV